MLLKNFDVILRSEMITPFSKIILVPMPEMITILEIEAQLDIEAVSKAQFNGARYALHWDYARQGVH